MIAFYRNLWGQKMSRIEALRQAQLDTLRGKLYRPTGVVRPAEGKREPRLPPYYWAAFALGGIWR
jgi:CHAT domain-containing protein